MRPHAGLRSCRESLSQTLRIVTLSDFCLLHFCGDKLRRMDLKVFIVFCSANFISFIEFCSQFLLQIPVRLGATTPARRGRVCRARSARFSQSGVRPRAGPVLQTPPRTRWARPPPPPASTRPVCTTRGRGWPSSRAPTTRPLCPG